MAVMNLCLPEESTGEMARIYMETFQRMISAYTAYRREVVELFSQRRRSRIPGTGEKTLWLFVKAQIWLCIR